MYHVGTYVPIYLYLSVYVPIYLCLLIKKIGNSLVVQ